METIKIIKISDGALVPIRASDGAIGYDVYAARVLDKHTKEVIGELPVKIPPGGSVLIGIGVVFSLPWGYQCEVRPRSGLASRYDIELSNSPGTVDPDFRGELGCLLRNRGDQVFTVESGMRIAQLIFTKVEVPIFEEIFDINDLPVTRRGVGGFGSTGLFGKGLGLDDYLEEQSRWDRYYMSVVLATAKMSECMRGVKKINGEYERDSEGRFVGQTRQFGCLIVQGQGVDSNINARGFNYQYHGAKKCCQAGCLREELGIPSGTQLENCRAIHAEQAALWQISRRGGIGAEGSTVYVNTEPCIICAKALAENRVDTVVMIQGVYPTNGTQILKEAGINIRYVKL